MTATGIRAPHTTPNSLFDVIAIASSAGGLKALCQLLAALPADLPAAVIVLQHMDRHHRSMLPGILGRHSPMDVHEARHGARLEPGVVYVAPRNKHLLVNPDATFALTDTAPVHFVRPSADLLFQSVADSFRDRAIGVVLTGTGMDGASGITALHRMGGRVIAQDQASSEFFGMPGSAIATGNVDYVLPLSEIPGAFVRLLATGKP